MKDDTRLGPSGPVWKFADGDEETPKSLPEAHGTVHIPRRANGFKTFLAFVGPGYMVSVGYMDPGNWATDLAGGAKFGYALLSVIILSNLMAVLLQALSARLGIATGRDLAQACHDSYPRLVRYALWIACEVAIVACDVAEVIGTAIALQLLFGLPIIVGAAVASLDAVLLLFLTSKGFRPLEAFVMALLGLTAICFGIETFIAAPPVAQILKGILPTKAILANPSMLYIAIGIVGATVMPHNLYLHSSIAQTRDYARTDEGKRKALKWVTLDSTVALTFALLVNAAILLLAAAVFHSRGHRDIEDLGQAFRLMSPLLGVAGASVLFAVALLASGINSTVTATLTGQIVMEGFVRIRLPQWLRRLVTRGIALLPVMLATSLFGPGGTAKLLVLSQVVLSVQLPFAVIPLVQFVGDKRKMGSLVAPKPILILAWLVAALIVALNLVLLWNTLLA